MFLQHAFSFRYRKVIITHLNMCEVFDYGRPCPFHSSISSANATHMINSGVQAAASNMQRKFCIKDFRQSQFFCILYSEMLQFVFNYFNADNTKS